MLFRSPRARSQTFLPIPTQPQSSSSPLHKRQRLSPTLTDNHSHTPKYASNPQHKSPHYPTVSNIQHPCMTITRGTQTLPYYSYHYHINNSQPTATSPNLTATPTRAQGSSTPHRPAMASTHLHLCFNELTSHQLSQPSHYPSARETVTTYTHSQLFEPKYTLTQAYRNVPLLCKGF